DATGLTIRLDDAEADWIVERADVADPTDLELRAVYLHAETRDLELPQVFRNRGVAQVFSARPNILDHRRWRKRRIDGDCAERVQSPETSRVRLLPPRAVKRREVADDVGGQCAVTAVSDHRIADAAESSRPGES